jgi:hypothetical protein
MKIEKLTFKEKGKTYSGEIAWPDNLEMAIGFLGERSVWEAFKIGYKLMIKAQIKGKPILPRKRVVKIDLSVLDEQTRIAIEGLLESLAVQQQPQQVAESAPPEQPHTDHNDYAEMLTEAEAQSSGHDSSFEEDFAKYLASLGS